MNDRTQTWQIGDMERTALQETAMVVLPGNIPMVAIMQMADDLGIKYEEIWIAKGYEGIIVTVMSVLKNEPLTKDQIDAMFEATDSARLARELGESD